MFGARLTMYFQKPNNENTIKQVELYLEDKINPVTEPMVEIARQSIRERLKMYDVQDPISMAFRKQLCVVFAQHYNTIATAEELKITEEHVKTILGVQ